MTRFGIGRVRGPYGTEEGDIWSGRDSEVGKKLFEHDGVHLIHEMMVKDGKLEDCIYTTTDPQIIEQAERGTELWLAAQAEQN